MLTNRSSRLAAAIWFLCLASLSLVLVPVQAGPKADAHLIDKFRQLGQDLRDPNVYRNASGAPGHEYWQQRADYKIVAMLDERNKSLAASSTIEYTNNSPDTLGYLWLQLDQNRFKLDSTENLTRAGEKDEIGGDRLSLSTMRRHQALQSREHGYEIEYVRDGRDRDLDNTIVGTMMRVELPTPLKPGARQTLKLAWSFNIVHRDAMSTRGGYEWFEDSDTYTYFLAQWFPRMVAYTDYTSWQHKQFIGRGEFTLEFGDYDVSLTVPSDHLISATGELKNEKAVLSAQHLERLSQARQADKPVFIVTPEEALENEQEKAQTMKTWRFVANNVRDFAWASSRKFIWDGMVHKQPNSEYPEVLAMSFYPNEAEPIWSKYSTEAVVHTMEVYSRFSFPYPYPTAQSVNTWKRGGMEYPMITFNGYRPDPIDADARAELVDDAPAQTYDRATKHSLIGVIIHEIGHIYFPMVVNSDERKWTWMDEGINSFLEHLAELEWEEDYFNYSSHASILDQIRGYMISPKQVPIMSDSESLLQFGPNAYTKPAAALTVLRETVLGRDLFDYAFREYARRWRFKRPTPTDFFRTMEDASAIDLDWFWRGWFYSTDHVDVDLVQVREYQIDSKDPATERPQQKVLADELAPEPISQIRNREEGRETRVQHRPELRDFYNEHDQYTVSNKDRNDYQTYLDGLESWERRVLDEAVAAGEYIYFVDFNNVGGLISPLPLQLMFADGSEQHMLIPAEVWRKNTDQVTKLLILPQRLMQLELDPLQQTADTDRSNNYYPRKILPSRLEMFKYERDRRNLMLENATKLKGKDDVAEGSDVPLQAVDGQ